MTGRTYVIAEAGSCHDGKFSAMERLIDAAQSAGADCVKIQYWSSAERLAQRRHAGEAVAAAYARHQVPTDWLPRVRASVDHVGLEAACTVYLPEDVWVVARHFDVLKVSSFESEDRELLTMMRAPLSVGKEVFVSLGMGASPDVSRECLAVVNASGRLRFLHCVSAYPAPLLQLRLRRLRGDVHGFSDHSPPTQEWTGALAVAAGATIIERHLRLTDTPADNPDFPHAMPPLTFSAYVRHIREAEAALGDPGPDVSQLCEEPMLAYRVRTP